jgi:hypothetical protein
MLTISRIDLPARLFSICLLLLLLLACESRDRYIGVYRAEADKGSKQTEVIMELKANGDGAWRMGDEEIPFTWYTKSGELRINTKGGGVIVGSMAADSFQVKLPSAGPLFFKKID